METLFSDTLCKGSDERREEGLLVGMKKDLLFFFILFSISTEALLEGLFQSDSVDARSTVLFHLPALFSLD